MQELIATLSRAVLEINSKWTNRCLDQTVGREGSYFVISLNLFYQSHSEIHGWQNFFMTKNFQMHQLPGYPMSKADMASKMQGLSWNQDVTLTWRSTPNFFLSIKRFANHGSLGGVDETHFGTFHRNLLGTNKYI